MAPARIELTTNGLGNRCSIQLSYGATEEEFKTESINCFPRAGVIFIVSSEIVADIVAVWLEKYSDRRSAATFRSATAQGCGNWVAYTSPRAAYRRR